MKPAMQAFIQANNLYHASDKGIKKSRGQIDKAELEGIMKMMAETNRTPSRKALCKAAATLRTMPSGLTLVVRDKRRESHKTNRRPSI